MVMVGMVVEVVVDAFGRVKVVVITVVGVSSGGRNMDLEKLALFRWGHDQMVHAQSPKGI